MERKIGEEGDLACENQEKGRNRSQKDLTKNEYRIEDKEKARGEG